MMIVGGGVVLATTPTGVRVSRIFIAAWACCGSSDVDVVAARGTVGGLDAAFVVVAARWGAMKIGMRCLGC